MHLKSNEIRTELDLVQVLLDGKARSTRFLLSGSSARKRRRGQANLTLRVGETTLVLREMDEGLQLLDQPRQREADDEVKRETRGMKKGGAVKGKWIQSAIKKPGALKKSLGVKAGEKIPAKKLATAAKAPGKLGQRARLAQTLKKMK